MKQLFDQLRAEAERQILPEPDTLRIRSDRRTARRRATGVLAVVLLMAGGVYATQPDDDALPGIELSPPPSPTPVATRDPNCNDTYPKQIPTDVFLPNGVEICFDPVERIHFVESVPLPCRPDPADTDPLIEDRRGFEYIVDENVPDPAPTRIHVTITRYLAQGAERYMTELARDIDSCGPVKVGDLTITYSASPGDGATVLVRARYDVPPDPEIGPATSTYLVAVTRVGSYVAVVYDKGWEGHPSQDKTIMDASQWLVTRLT